MSLHSGCAALFGWDIHAPGLLSENFYREVEPVHVRLALSVPKELLEFKSQDRGSWDADPQTYHVGEAFGPMLVEAFQSVFDEFIFMEVEPTPAILNRYGISYLVLVRIKDFQNRVGWRGQAVTLVTETVVLDPGFKERIRFESRGLSDAEKVFAKKGGPEVNLNAALENNALAIVQYLGDWIESNA